MELFGGDPRHRLIGGVRRRHRRGQIQTGTNTNRRLATRHTSARNRHRRHRNNCNTRSYRTDRAVLDDDICAACRVFLVAVVVPRPLPLLNTNSTWPLSVPSIVYLT